MASPDTLKRIRISKIKEDKPKQDNAESLPAYPALPMGATNNRQVGNGTVCEGYINISWHKLLQKRSSINFLWYKSYNQVIKLLKLDLVKG